MRVLELFSYLLENFVLRTKLAFHHVPGNLNKVEDQLSGWQKIKSVWPTIMQNNESIDEVLNYIHHDYYGVTSIWPKPRDNDRHVKKDSG